MHDTKGKLSVRGLARILHEEFERDLWGAIEPDLFARVADPTDEDENENEEDPDAIALERVLERVVARLEVGERQGPKE